MGRINKVMEPRHEASLSPYIREFVASVADEFETPTFKIPARLETFPREWPFPRGDCHHWIPLLNRFDDILRQFISAYELDNGPQEIPFSEKMLAQDVKQNGKSVPSTASLRDGLDHLDESADRAVIESILDFTALLFDHCSNRSLYRSGDRLNCLLNTGSLSLLKHTLRLTFRMAKRVWATRARSNTTETPEHVLKETYGLDIQRLLAMAAPFAIGKSHVDKDDDQSFHASNLLLILQNKIPDQFRDHYTYNLPKTFRHAEFLQPLSTPSRSSSSSQPKSISAHSRSTDLEAGIINISRSEMKKKSYTGLMQQYSKRLPKDQVYEFFHKLRVYSAVVSGQKEELSDLVACRLLAVANLAYVQSDGSFDSKTTRLWQEEPRRYQLPLQLAELMQPSDTGSYEEASTETQIYAMGALEAMCVQKSINLEVYYALSANVNHGILFHLVRKAVTQLGTDDVDGEIDYEEEEWRDALLELLKCIPASAPRAADNLHTAGMLEILKQVLLLNTAKARRIHCAIIGYLDFFVQTLRESLETFLHINGLEAVNELIGRTVESAMDPSSDDPSRPKSMPKEYRSRVAEYSIEFFQQSTLRWSFRLLTRLMQMNNSNRHIRNLFDSGVMQKSLHTILSNSDVFGSSVWSAAVNYISSFLNNEPTSYSVIAEAKLPESFLKVLETRINLPEPRYLQDTTTVRTLPGLDGEPFKGGVLPSPEAMLAVPNAMSALCLNEAGMGYFKNPNLVSNFLEIFESYPHVQTFCEDHSLATRLGEHFDELVRHHGDMDAGISEDTPKAVKRMLSRVAYRVEVESVNFGLGTKLYINSKDSNGSKSVVVSGGRKAMHGIERDFAKERMECNDDLRDPRKIVEHADYDQKMFKDYLDVSQPNPTLTYEEVVQNTKAGLPPYLMVGAAVKFVYGFCNSVNTRQIFLENGSLEYFLDLVMSPAIPYRFARASYAGELSKVLITLIEDQPYVVIPSIIRRIDRALEILEPFMQNTSEIAYYAPFVYLPKGDEDKSTGHVKGSIPLEMGTYHVKALISLSLLCGTLAKAFQTAQYNPRSSSSSNLFQQANLADIYVKLIDKLSRLFRSTIWELTLLNYHVPQEWSKTAQTGDQSFFGLETEELQKMPEQPEEDKVNGDWLDYEAQYLNSRIIRNVLYTTGHVVQQLFQAMCKVLLARRSSSSMGESSFQRQRSFWMAERIALGLREQLNFVAPRGSVNFKCAAGYWTTILQNVRMLLVEDSRSPSSHTLTLLLLCFKNLNGFREIDYILDRFLEKIQEPRNNGSRSDGEDVDNSDDDNVLPNQDDTLTFAAPVRTMCLHGIKTLLQLYCSVIDYRHVHDAVQTTVLVTAARHSSDRDSSHSNGGIAGFYSVGQLLVELRLSAIQSIKKLWRTEFLGNERTGRVDSENNAEAHKTELPLRELIRTVKLILEGEGESSNALMTRQDVEAKRSRLQQIYDIPPNGFNGSGGKKWVPRQSALDFIRNSSHTSELAPTEMNLALESVFRTFGQDQPADRYCAVALRQNSRFRRVPVPEGSMEIPSWASGSTMGTTDGDSREGEIREDREENEEEHEREEDEESRDQGDVMMSDAGEENGAMQIGGPNAASVSSSGTGSSHRLAVRGSEQHQDQSSTPDQSSQKQNQLVLARIPTVEDLEDDRKELRDNLLQNCLDILANRADVTFELRDLIDSATRSPKFMEAEKANIAPTTLYSLLSLNVENGNDETDGEPLGEKQSIAERIKEQYKRIGVLAHFVGLLLSNKTFLETALQQFKDNQCLPELLQLIRPRTPEEMPVDCYDLFVPEVLFIVEQLMIRDAEPPKDIWEAPLPDSPIENPPKKPFETPKRFLSDDQRVEIFEAVVAIMPKVGGKSPFAQAILRCLAMLTRSRKLALKMVDRKILSTLMSMMKQSLAHTIRDASPQNPEVKSRLFATVMLIFRQIIEDEATLRRIMCNDIRNAFEHRAPRAIDGNSLLRTLWSTVIRDPELFVDAAEEMVIVRRYDQKMGSSQHLELKKDDKLVVETSDKNQSKDGETEKLKGKENADGIAELKQDDEKENVTEKPKPEIQDLKMPALENSEGLIEYLLHELLAYKDVDDPSTVTPKPKESITKTNMDSNNGDVEMGEASSVTGNEANSTTGSKTQNGSADLTSGTSEVFRIEDYPIFRYRCFILQCLTELLGGYNKAKVEFLHFRRRGGSSLDSHSNTPLKPRVTILKYLLTSLIPQGIITHAEDIPGKKRETISYWASSVIQALCAKTFEVPYRLPHPNVDSHVDLASYEEEPELAYVRNHVLDQCLKAFRDAEVNTASDTEEIRLSRLMHIAHLFTRLPMVKHTQTGISPHMTGTMLSGSGNPVYVEVSNKLLSKMMYEKGFVAALMSAVADIDLSYPGTRRVVKYIMRPVKSLTEMSNHLSVHSTSSTDVPVTLGTGEGDEAEYSEDDASQDMDSIDIVAEARDSTPNLQYSSLDAFESAGHEDDEEDEDEDMLDDEMEMDEDDEEDEDVVVQAYDDDDEDDYDEEVDVDDMEDDMDYEEADRDENISDEELDVTHGHHHHHHHHHDHHLLGPVEMEIDMDLAAPGQDSSSSSSDSDDTSEDEDDEDIEDDDDDNEDESVLEDSDEEAQILSTAMPTSDAWGDEEDELDDGDEVIIHEDGDGDDFGALPNESGLATFDFDQQRQLLEELNRFRAGSRTGGPLDPLADFPNDDEMDEEEDDYEDDEDDVDDVAFPGGADDDEITDDMGLSHFQDAVRASGMPGSAARAMFDDWRPHHDALGHHSHHLRMRHGHDPSHSFPRPRAHDDGSNPLSQQRQSGQDPIHSHNHHHLSSLRQSPIARIGGAIAHLIEDMTNRQISGNQNNHWFSDILSMIDSPHIGQIHLSVDASALGGPRSLFIDGTGPGGPILAADTRFGDMRHITRSIANHHRSSTRSTEPLVAASVDIATTNQRWQETGRMLFGTASQDRALNVAPAIHYRLVPPARERQKIEDAKLKREKEEREERDRKEKEEKLAKEQKEKEEREAREKEEREARERAAAAAAEAARVAAAQVAQEVSASTDDAMDGVESTSPAVIEESGTGEAGTSVGQPEASSSTQAEATTPAPRIIRRIRDRDVDITDLGIDPEFLDGLPPEFIEEAIIGAMAHRPQPQQTEAEEDVVELDPAVLEALPPDVRDEVLSEHRHLRREAERRRRREEAAAASNVDGGAAIRSPEDMDPASFFATLDGTLRQQVLAEIDPDSLSSLPEHIAAEARALGAGRTPRYYHDLQRRNAMDRTGHHHPGFGTEAHQRASSRPSRPHVYAQVFDKAGISALMRLLFLTSHGSGATYVWETIMLACNNRQNRAEIVNQLLAILIDGSSGDFTTLEKTFANITKNAKPVALSASQSGPPTTPRTPKTPKAESFLNTSGPLALAEDITPLKIVWQAVELLSYITHHNTKVIEYLLTEQDSTSGVVGARGTRSAKKGKARETKASRYPIDAVIGLLDRKLIMENPQLVERMCDLLNVATYPLMVVAKKREQEEKEAREKKAKEEEKAKKALEGASADNASSVPQTEDDTKQKAETTEGQDGVQTSLNDDTKDLSKEEEEDKKKKALPAPPEISDHNLGLVVSVISSPECGSKTFKHILSVITNLATIPKAKAIFAEKLNLLAKDLGEKVLQDLKNLRLEIEQAESISDIKRASFTKFSVSSADQNKLLRVITALHFTQDIMSKSDNETKDDNGKTGRLYEVSSFVGLFRMLSDCLTAIRDRGNMANVANVLLPLIEVLMFASKNEISSLSNPATDEQLKEASDLAKFFYHFTEEHRIILNDLVRNNPKLMTGSFSLLIKNSKVLEFDNKRNYFSRKLHSKSAMERPSYPPLQITVKRSSIFHDSYRSLFFKKPDEIKYGKLNVKFAHEEAVDAGGVTREWFHELVKQMFNPDYVLFNPIASDRTTFHPNPLSSINSEHLNFFQFVGRIIGKALYENRHLDCHFSTAVYKRILGKTVHIKDMEAHDLSFYNGLEYMLSNDISDVGELTFSDDVENFGRTDTIDLIPNGRNILVTNENKLEYCKLMVQHRLVGSVSDQLDAVLKGFFEVIPKDLISIFTEQELELLISGLPDIDIDDWKNNTDYTGYTSSSPQIVWFWRAVRSFSKEDRAKLLQFATGTSKVPLNGFKELEGMNGHSRFNIHKEFHTKRLPSAHTCFNQLDLPEYESYEVLRDQLLVAIEQGTGYFGFV